MALTCRITWVPHPRVVAMDFERAAAAAANMYGPLELSKTIAAADTAETFQSKISPEGTPWQPWSDSTIQFNLTNELMILTGELESAAVSGFEIEAGHQIVWNPAGAPDRWLWHEEGRLGRLTPLPARPFIGLSEEAEEQVYRVFLEWFDGIINIISYGGGGQGPRIQGRDKMGRFTAVQPLLDYLRAG